MIFDRTHVRWGVGTGVAILFVSYLYTANNDAPLLVRWHIPDVLPSSLKPGPPSDGNIAGSPLGLVFGTLALLIFLFAALLGMRRNHPTWPIVRIKFWLRAHVYLTIFTIPLVIFHSGFHWGGIMTQVLVWLYAFVMISGFWGLALQNIIPTMMHRRLPEEAVFEQIPALRRDIFSAAKELRREFILRMQNSGTADDRGGVATQAGLDTAALMLATTFFDQEVLPYLRPPEVALSDLLEKEKPDDDEQPMPATAVPRRNVRQSPLISPQQSNAEFETIRLQLSPETQGILRRMQDLCDEKRRLDLQTRLHYWLHTWLIVHAPASLLLIVLTLVHAVVAYFLYT